MTPEQLAVEEAENDRQARIHWSGLHRDDCIRDSGLADVMSEFCFESYRIRDEKQKPALCACRSFLKHFSKTKKGPALWGDTGVGKSHLLRATCIAALHQEEMLRAKYLDCVTLSRSLQTNKRLVEWAVDCDLLALDDIGKALCLNRSDYSLRPAYDAVVDILQIVDTHGRPKLACTAQAPLRSVRGGSGEIVRPGYEDSSDLSDYLVGRLDRHFHWFEVDGPNGRNAKYWDDGEGEWWTK
jgi:hypothetical protein